MTAAVAYLCAGKICSIPHFSQCQISFPPYM
nr:MAG TPA_asm: hypothetical protein [Caudoviricetes sp.]